MKTRFHLIKILLAVSLLTPGCPAWAQPPEPRIEVLAKPVITDIKQKKETVEGA